MVATSLFALCSTELFFGSAAAAPPRLRQQLHLGRPAADKKCDTKKAKWAMQLLEKDASQQRIEANTTAEDKIVYFDGFSRYGCETDKSPKEQRVYFKDHACGKLPSCRLLELGMKPRLCFDFCRDKQGTRFFGIENGRDCYCTGYIHAKSTGSGECDQACQGDTKEMCGGMTKSSVFEMHMCGDSTAEAAEASANAEETVNSIESLAKTSTETATKLRALGKDWQLGVCSVKPEGERVCSPPAGWLKMAGDVEAAAAESSHEAEVVEKRGKELGAALKAVEDAGEEVNAKQASKLELATNALIEATVKAKGVAAATKLAYQTISNPFAGGPLGSFSNVFKEVGDTENGWNALCALTPIKGQSYAGLFSDQPESHCGNLCLGMSTGTEACVAFNYQFKDGVAACQLLNRNGVVKPDISLVYAVPIFEVSDSKKADMKLGKIGCYVNKGFMAGHPKGPLTTEVIREISVSL